MSAELSVKLTCGAFELDLCPAVGGVITRFRHDGRDLMRPAGAAFAADRNPGLAACFPLVPFSNRIADARFQFQGQAFELARNFPPEPHAIHGHGWQQPWTVTATTATSAVLALRHAVAASPFDYEALQRFELTDEGLRITIGVTNLGTGPMPAGIGLHPYFPRSPGVTLAAALDHVWMADQRNLPQERRPLPASWDFSRAPMLDPLTMDNCFGGFRGRAAISWPEADLTLAIEADPVFGHLVIYVPRDANFFCVEPVSHMNDGFNHEARGTQATGVRVLAVGENLSGSVRFTIV